MQTSTPSPALLDARQVARMLGCSPRKIAAMTASGELPSIKLGRLRKYRPEAVQQYVARLESGNADSAR